MSRKPLFWSTTAVCLVLGIACPAAAERQLTTYEGLSVLLPDDFTCAESAQVIVRASNASSFAGNRARLQKLVGGIRAILGFECPEVSDLIIVGQVGSDEVYRGFASSHNGWTLEQVEGGGGTRAATPVEHPASVSLGARASSARANPNSLSSLAGARTMAQKCEALAGWLDQLRSAYPELGTGRTVLGKIYPKAANLYRDPYFVPVFGVPYDQTSKNFRLQLHRNVVRACYQDRNYAQRFAPFRQLIDASMLLPHGNFSFQRVSAMVAERRNLRRWMDQVLDDSNNLSPTEESYTRIESALRKGERDLADLWPDERRLFVSTMNSRKAELAGAVARTELANLPDDPASLEKIEQIVTSAKRRVGPGGSGKEIDRIASERARQVAENAFPKYQAELAAYPATFAAAQEIAQRADALGRLLDNLAPEFRESYEQAATERSQEIQDELAVAALEEIRDSSADFTETESILELGEQHAKAFEAAGNSAKAEVIRQAAKDKANEELEASLPSFKQRLSELEQTRETAAELEALAADFEEQEVTLSAFSEYRKEASDRSRRMIDEICNGVIERIGISSSDANKTILGPEQGMTLRDFVCELDAQGVEVAEFAAPGLFGSEYLMEVRAPDETVKIKLKEAKSPSGEDILVGFALGDGEEQGDISESEWQRYAGGLLAGTGPAAIAAADSAAACDQLAGHPDDPASEGPGVEDADVDVEAAAEACLQAFEFFPETPRIVFQLGRVAYIAEEYETAVSLFAQATEAGHAPAAAYLGDMFIQGLGVEADEETGLELYEAAAEGGFAPAKKLIAELGPEPTDLPDQDFEGAPDSMNAGLGGGGGAGFTDEQYYKPELMAALYKGAYDSVPDDQATRSHVASVLRAFVDVCGAQLPSNVAMASTAYVSPQMREINRNPMNSLAMIGKFLESATRGPAAFQAYQQKQAVFTVEGVRDGRVFINQHGCDGRAAYQLQDNISNVVLSRSGREPAAAQPTKP